MCSEKIEGNDNHLLKWESMVQSPEDLLLKEDDELIIS